MIQGAYVCYIKSGGVCVHIKSDLSKRTLVSWAVDNQYKPVLMIGGEL